MKVTVSEALRIRKIMAKEIESNMPEAPKRRLYGADKDSAISYGVTKHNDKVMLSEGVIKITDKMNAIEKLLSFKHSLDMVLADFNHENNIGNMVREKENLNTIFKVFDEVIAPKSKSKKVTKKETTDNGPVLVNVEFEPHFSQTEVKKKIKETRRSIMEIQTKIDKLNAKSIELPFDLDDYEDILSILN